MSVVINIDEESSASYIGCCHIWNIKSFWKHMFFCFHVVSVWKQTSMLKTVLTSKSDVDIIQYLLSKWDQEDKRCGYNIVLFVQNITKFVLKETFRCVNETRSFLDRHYDHLQGAKKPFSMSHWCQVFFYSHLVLIVHWVKVQSLRCADPVNKTEFNLIYSGSARPWASTQVI